MRSKLERYPQARFEETARSLRVFPLTQKGFPVTLWVDGGEFNVFFDGWHAHFETEDEAIACFGFGLSSRCRLELTFRGDHPVKWTVESLENDKWSRIDTTGRLFIPFWRRKRIEHRTNTLIESPSGR